MAIPDARRAASLAHRADRVEGEARHEEVALLDARHYAENGRHLSVANSVSGQAAVPGTPQSRAAREKREQGNSGSRPQHIGRGVHSADWPLGPGGLREEPGNTVPVDERSVERGSGASQEITRWWNAPEQTSRVMRDIREIEAGRKRNPGYDQE